MTQPVITVTATIMDGAVVRWHRSVDAAGLHQPVVSASRNGVSIHTEYLHQVPEEWLAAAVETYADLRADRNADLTHLATHRHYGALNGPLRPVEQEEGGDG